MNKRVPITDAAMRLSLTYHSTRNLVLSGKLAGGRDNYGRFYVEEAAIRRILRERKEGDSK